jgi:hypothetical protein
MKTKKLLTSRQKKLLKNNDFFVVFNEIHNSHLSTNVGQVKVMTDEKKNNTKKKK